MADRFVQQHARPAGTEHHGHRARRRLHGVEVDQSLAHGLAGDLLGGAVGSGREDRSEVVSAARPAETPFPASALLRDDAHVEPDQRADISRQRAVARDDQVDLVAGGHARGDLRDPGIERARKRVDARQEGHLVVFARRADGV